MKRHLSKTLVSTLTVAVFIATAFCCNFPSKQSKVCALANAKKMASCHSQKAAPAAPAKTADCCKTSLKGDVLTKIFSSTPQSVNDLALLETASQEPSAFKNTFELASLNSPPGRDTPLYILSHSFRI